MNETTWSFNSYKRHTNKKPEDWLGHMDFDLEKWLGQFSYFGSTTKMPCAYEGISERKIEKEENKLLGHYLKEIDRY